MRRVRCELRSTKLCQCSGCDTNESIVVKENIGIHVCVYMYGGDDTRSQYSAGLLLSFSFTFPVTVMKKVFDIIISV